MLKPLKQTSPL